MFNTNSAHKAILCPKNFLIVLTALVCFLSSAVVSAQQVGRMDSALARAGNVPGNSCDAGLTEPISDSDRSNCISVDDSNLDATNTTNISRTIAPSQGGATLGIIDWVVVELRVFGNGDVSARPADAVETYRQPALLRSDGTVVNATAENLLATDGDDSILTLGFEGFDNSTQDAYIIIEHRGHLGLMSANPIVPDEEYNFGESGSQIRGGATNSVDPGDNPNKASTVWSAIGGDVDRNTNVFGPDTEIVLGTQGQVGYLPGDVNINGTVFGEDTETVLRRQGRAQSYNSSN